MEKNCINCRYIGSVLGRKGFVCGLVCVLSRDFKSVNRNDTCDNFVKDIGECSRCGSRNIEAHSFSPKEKPYVVRTEYRCKVCENFWYEDD